MPDTDIVKTALDSAFVSYVEKAFGAAVAIPNDDIEAAFSRFEKAVRRGHAFYMTAVMKLTNAPPAK